MQEKYYGWGLGVSGCGRNIRGGDWGVSGCLRNIRGGDWAVSGCRRNITGRDWGVSGCMRTQKVSEPYTCLNWLEVLIISIPYWSTPGCWSSVSPADPCLILTPNETAISCCQENVAFKLQQPRYNLLNMKWLFHFVLQPASSNTVLVKL